MVCDGISCETDQHHTTQHNKTHLPLVELILVTSLRKVQPSVSVSPLLR